MAATTKLAITFLLLVSGLLVLGDAKETKATCGVVCVQGGHITGTKLEKNPNGLRPWHITCDNYPGQELDGCVCECAPKDGKGCVLHPNRSPAIMCTTTPEY